MLVWLKPHEQIKIVVEEIVKLNWVTQIVLEPVGLGCGE